MPGPWRRPMLLPVRRSHGRFQSQTRCQAPGDAQRCSCGRRRWLYFNLRRDARPLATLALRADLLSPMLFQSQTRCQAPGDDIDSDEYKQWWGNFNLRRDARPLATHKTMRAAVARLEFQSQTRCQAPGDVGLATVAFVAMKISISDEMPGPWRLRCASFGL